MSSQVLSTQEISEPTLLAWVRFLRAHAALTRELGARLEADHGLTMSDYDVLIQLYFAEGHAMRRVDIARHGFQSVTYQLAGDYENFSEICDRHGMAISPTRVRKVVKHFASERGRTGGWRKILEQTTGTLLRQSGDAAD